MTLVSIPTNRLQVGDVFHAHGARFVVESQINTYPDTIHLGGSRYISVGPNSGVANISRWLDGKIIPGYFGPDRTWNEQGNHLARTTVERA